MSVSFKLSPNINIPHSINLLLFFILVLCYVELTQSISRKETKIHRPKTFHLLGVAHTKTSRDYIACPFTQKVFRLCSMLTSLGHHVIHYGVEGSDVVGRCSEDVIVLKDEDQKRVYGDVDWKKGHPWVFDPNDEANVIFQQNAIREIKLRKQQDDILLMSHGVHHRPISENVDLPLSVEIGVGYAGTFASYRVWESSAWMHWIYAREERVEGRWYDVVIPAFFDVSEFQLFDRDQKEDYFLFVGRLNYDKGIEIAAKVSQKLGKKLLIAGQGTLSQALDVNKYSDTIEFIGPITTLSQKNSLMGKAKALFVPSFYFEPFGYVVIEANLVGTPVITSDWGAFRENVLHGVSGFRCHTLGEFVRAAELVDGLDPKTIRKWAEDNYSMDKIKIQYDLYFDRLQNLGWGMGWYSDYHIESEKEFLTNENRLFDIKEDNVNRKKSSSSNSFKRKRRDDEIF